MIIGSPSLSTPNESGHHGGSTRSQDRHTLKSTPLRTYFFLKVLQPRNSATSQGPSVQLEYKSLAKAGLK